MSTDRFRHPWLPGYWVERYTAKRDAEERDRREWIEDVKRRLGIRCIGDKAVPEWPVLDLPEGITYRVIADQAMASYDGVHFYVKPDEMSTAEFFASLPR